MKKLVALLLAVMLAAAILPGAALADSARRTVFVSSTGSGTLNLRSGPGKGYEPKGYVYHGDTVTVLNRSGEWSKVKTTSGRIGWIKTKYIDGTTKALGTGIREFRQPALRPRHGLHHQGQRAKRRVREGAQHRRRLGEGNGFRFRQDGLDHGEVHRRPGLHGHRAFLV